MLVGSMMDGRISGTGHFERIVFNSRSQEIHLESLLPRVTGVAQSLDCYLKVLLDEENGTFLRIESLKPN